MLSKIFSAALPWQTHPTSTWVFVLLVLAVLVVLILITRERS